MDVVLGVHVICLGNARYRIDPPPRRRVAMRSIAVGMLLTCTLPLDTPASLASVSYETVVMAGDAAPGTQAGVDFHFLNTPVINNAGQVAFRGFLTGSGVDAGNNSGLWVGTSDLLTLAFRAGDPAPGVGAGVLAGEPGYPSINNAGDIAFQSDLVGTGVSAANDTGLWTTSAGTPTLVAREGDTVQDIGPGTQFGNFFTAPLFNDARQVAFRNTLTGTGVSNANRHAMFHGDSSSLELVAREDGPAPNLGPGVFHKYVNSVDTLNADGTISFVNTLEGPNVNTDNQYVLWAGGPDTLMPVMRAGDLAPGIGQDASFYAPRRPDMNASGQIVFASTLTGSGIDSSNDIAIWTGTPDALDLVAREGDQAPGTEPGVLFSSFNPTVIGGSGEVAFLGWLSGPGVDASNDTGIWVGGPDSLTLIAREGDLAPGAGPDARFGSFKYPSINSRGQVAFTSFLKGPGLDFSNDFGLWATDANDHLALIAREGDPFDLNDDPQIEDLHTISGVVVAFSESIGHGGEDGRPTAFNDNGQLAFRLTFYGGNEGIFVATIPEPASLVLLALGLPALVRRLQ